MQDNPDWKDKFCVVTGVASGIGAATAKSLANQEARVLGLDRLDESEFRTKASGLSKIEYKKCDLSSPKEIEQVFGAISREKLSALFNVAAMPSHGLGISELSVEQWDQVLAVNLRAVFLLSKFSLPLFKSNSGGTIVNVSSVHAFASMKNHAAYAASKGGLNSLTSQLALELNPLGVRVVAVAPGSINTPMTTKDLAKDRKLLEDLGFPTDGKSIGHVGQPEEIAEILIWIASPKASFINGTTITADAGLLARLAYE